MLPTILPGSMKPYWDPSLSNRDYHSIRHAISSTGLKHLKKSPLEFYSQWVDSKKKQTEAMRFGTLVHDVIERVIIQHRTLSQMPEFGDLRSKGNREAKEYWDKQKDPGEIYLDAEDMERIERILKSLRSNKKAMALLFRGEAENSGFYRDPNTGIFSRFRPDFYNSHFNMLIDYKTCQNVSREAVSRDIHSYSYHLSAFFYMYGIEQLTGTRPEGFIYLFIETLPPYDTVLYLAKPEMIAKGELAYHDLMGKLRVCLETESWPGYQEFSDPENHRILEIDLPAYAYKENF